MSSQQVKEYHLKTRCKVYLLFIIGILVLLNLTIVVKLGTFTDIWERFTLQDGLILYEICNKKWWSKEKKIFEVYQDKETPFKEFLLAK